MSRTDTERLDWLETHPYTTFGPEIVRDDAGRLKGIEPPWEIECYLPHAPHNLGAVHSGQTLREAIDAAMNGDNAVHPEQLVGVPNGDATEAKP